MAVFNTNTLIFRGLSGRKNIATALKLRTVIQKRALVHSVWPPLSRFRELDALTTAQLYR